MAVPDRSRSWDDLEEWSGPVRIPAREPTAPRRAGASRRVRLIRRRRLDLLQDAVAGLLLAIFVLVMCAGLGVVALLALGAGLILLASLVVERRRRRRALL